jgi:hypothetical protein
MTLALKSRPCAQTFGLSGSGSKYLYTSNESFYGVNPHGDVETLTDATTGHTTSTYPLHRLRSTRQGRHHQPTPEEVGDRALSYRPMEL